jgi:hypothetical protein
VSRRAAIESASRESTQVRAWRVLHVSDSTNWLNALVSGQLELGMRPEVLSRQATLRAHEIYSSSKRNSVESSTSLVQLWRQVRVWDQLIRSAVRSGDFEVIHAHGLASALAAVRSDKSVVYELARLAGDVAGATMTESQSHPWLNRALRSAEQFAMHRAVVVCHEESVGNELIDRGLDSRDVFVIPEAMLVTAPPQPRPEWLHRHGVDPRHNVVLFAPAWRLEIDAHGELTPASRTLLEVFAVIAAEADEALFLAEFDRKAREAIDEWSVALGIKSRLHLMSVEERRAGELAADIVLVGDVPTGETGALNPCAVRALQNRKALLAADVTCNRDLTPDGRGCLWYAHESPRDLARRAAFLVRNPDFRRSIAAAGHNYLRDSRDPVGVATRYETVYRRAQSRIERGRIIPPLVSLAPVQMVA